jgi:hypothetical protein
MSNHASSRINGGGGGNGSTSTTQSILQTVAAVQEGMVEDELSKYDALLVDDTALDKLRQNRLAELKQTAARHQKYRQLGHGQYTELQHGSMDIAKTFFTISKQSDRVVVHFYKPSSAHVCDIFHKHLQKLAERHIETKFIKINVESVLNDSTSIGTSSTTHNEVTFLVERLHVSVMPTLVLIQNREVVHKVQGFDELGNTDTFSTNTLAKLLLSYGMVDQNNIDDDDEDESSNNNNYYNNSSSRKGGTQAVRFIKKGDSDTTRRSIYDADDD